MKKKKKRWRKKTNYSLKVQNKSWMLEDLKMVMVGDRIVCVQAEGTLWLT